MGEVPWTYVQNLPWLDSRYAIYCRTDPGRALLIDFASGKEVPVAGGLGPVHRVVRVPGSDNQYVVITNRTMAKIEISAQESETYIDRQEKVNDKGICRTPGRLTPPAQLPTGSVFPRKGRFDHYFSRISRASGDPF